MTFDGGQPFIDGAPLTVAQPHTITALTDATASKVTFNRDGGKDIRTDTAAPFEFAWSPNALGDHTMAATPANSAGQNGVTMTVSFKVVTASPTPTPPVPTPTATPSPTATATASPSPTATPTPANVQVTVTWDATPGDSYKLYYGIETGKYIYVLPVGTTGSYTLSGLTPLTTYYFALTAVRNGTESLKSSEVPYTTTLQLKQLLKLPFKPTP